jgi:signal transduction histidine kinase
MVLRRQMTDIGDVLREIGGLFQEELRRRQLRLALNVPPALAPVSCDPDKIRQVLSNLVTNAIKFSPDGGEIELGVEERGADAVLHCRDTGIGIPAPEQEKIFEKFYQVDSTATRRFGGAGLGLSIAKEIVLLHGGRIWVESAPGAGSTFFVSLPKAPPRDFPGEAPNGPPPVTS